MTILSDANEQEKRKQMIKKTFDTVSTGYDSPALRFFHESAKCMTDFMEFRGVEKVLDVAAGTGRLSLAIAQSLPAGRITGIDFSAGMLDQARSKAEATGIRNAEFVEMDMQDIRFPDNHFDAAVCGFGIFFVEEMERQLRHIADKVSPGGKVAISNFYGEMFTPIGGMFLDRIKGYGVEIPPFTWKRIASEDKCKELFQSAGLTNIRSEVKNVGYYLKDVDEWWDVIWFAGFRGMVNQLSPEDLKRFREEHLEEVRMTGTKEGIWLDVEVIYTVGTKPQTRRFAT